MKDYIGIYLKDAWGPVKALLDRKRFTTLAALLSSLIAGCALLQQPTVQDPSSPTTKKVTADGLEVSAANWQTDFKLRQDALTAEAEKKSREYQLAFDQLASLNERRNGVITAINTAVGAIPGWGQYLSLGLGALGLGALADHGRKDGIITLLKAGIDPTEKALGIPRKPKLVIPPRDV